MINRAAGFVMDHWRGRQSLAWSIIVNLILLRAAIMVAQDWFAPAEKTDYSEQAIAVYALAVLAHGVIFTWQIVGVLRSAEQHVSQKGSMAGAWGAQLCAIVAFWFAATDAFGAWQMTIPVPKEENFAVRMDREHASRYQLTASTDGRTLFLTGTIEHGISRRLARELKDRPDTRLLVLESDGGNIYEARGLSRLIREKGLDTRAEAHCSSACMTVFIAGKRRTIGHHARLGFHQYRIDAGYEVPNADPAAEQERDRAIYATSGVEKWFRDKMFQKAADQMWWPSTDELLRSGVIHAVSPQ